jgi:Mg-chelatase subunit ChlD
MWLFSTKLDGDRDYRVLLPMHTVSEQLAGGALSTLAAVRATPNGATGLYDSVLAAYQDSRRNWAPGRINTVVVLTDGRNEDPGGIGLDELLRRLRELQDPARPLTVIGIGIGPGIDPAELRAIATATGGQAFTTADPTKIGDVFYAALSRMLCQPPACTAPGG